jgi:hypothetical protein
MVSLEGALGQVCTLPILGDPLSKNFKKCQEVWRSLACAGSRQRSRILRTLSGRSQAIGLRWFIDLIWQRFSYSNVNMSWTNPLFLALSHIRNKNQPLPVFFLKKKREYENRQLRIVINLRVNPN